MRLLIIEDNKALAESISNAIGSCRTFETAVADDPELAVKAISETNLELIVINVEFPGVDRILRLIRSADFGTVVFLVGNRIEQSTQVYLNKCDGFILKDHLEADIADCMKNFALISKRQTRMTVNTFGRFRVFVSGETIDFHNNKAKELFALCIDHAGGEVSMSEAIDKLWPDRVYDDRVKRLYRKAASAVNAALEQYELQDLFVIGKGYCCVKRYMIDCDYFRFLEDPEKNTDNFDGEYMFEYSWAEQTIGNLYRLQEKYRHQAR